MVCMNVYNQYAVYIKISLQQLRTLPLGSIACFYHGVYIEVKKICDKMRQNVTALYCVAKDGEESPSDFPDYQIFTDWQQAPRFSTIFVNIITFTIIIILTNTFATFIDISLAQFPLSGHLTQTLEHQ